LRPERYERLAGALTQTAIQAQADIVQPMTQVFDRPTPYTLNSTNVSPATKTQLDTGPARCHWLLS